MISIFKRNNIFLKKFLKSMFSVTFGNMIMKISIMFLNITLLNYAENIKSVDIAKIFALGLSSASLLYFSSSRYVAREYLKNHVNLKVLIKKTFIIIYSISMLTLPLILLLYSGEKNISFIVSIICFMFFLSFFDFFVSLSNAIGLNSYAAIGQLILAVSVLILILIANYNYSFFVAIAIPFFITFSIIASILMYKSLVNKRNIKSDLSNKTSFKKMIYYSLPLLLGNIFFNPLILWSASEIAGIDNKNFIVFIACLNMLGMAMLIPGQVNTAAFSFLLKSETYSDNRIIIFTILLISSFLSFFIVNAIFPYLDIVYGNEIKNMLTPVFWMTLSVFPFVIIQYCSSRLFLSGSPWSDTFSNILFGVVFLGGCFMIRKYDLGIVEISKLIFLCYILRFIFIFFVYVRIVKRKMIG